MIYHNQSRKCGEGAGLDLFPSDSLQSQLYEFIEIVHIGPYYGVPWLELLELFTSFCRLQS